MTRPVSARCRTLAALTSVALAMACSDTPITVPATPATSHNDAGADMTGYQITNLGTLGGSFSIAFGINNAGHVAGGANDADEVQRYFLWRDGTMRNAGSLGGNGNAALNGHDELAGLSETTEMDPDGEDVCGLGTHRICLAALWRKGTMTPLKALGGRNATAANINDRGEAVGFAETAVRDASCAAGTPFQLHRYQAAVWGPKLGEVSALPPLPGDEVGFAIGLNAHGQVVGATGLCATTLVTGRVAGPHAVLWDHGVPLALDPPHSHFTISTAAGINDRGDVVGGSATNTLHSFLWTRAAGKTDLGTVEDDLGSFATSINARGDVVGISCINDPLCDITNPALLGRAYLWRNGVMSDLNALVTGDSPLFLITAQAINDVGQIVGLAFDTELGQPRAYLATPVHAAAGAMRGSRGVASPARLPEGARALMQWSPAAHRR